MPLVPLWLLALVFTTALPQPAPAREIGPPVQVAEVVYDGSDDGDGGPLQRSLAVRRTFGHGLKFKPQELYRSFQVEAPYRAFLPPEADLSAWFPPPRDQGDQASCVAWSVGYAMRGYYANRALGRTGAQSSVALSPSFVFNQIIDESDGCDSGSMIADALTLLQNKGIVPLSRFPYRDSECRRQPAPQVVQEAAQFRISGWRTVALSRLTDIKGQLAKGDPVVIGMQVNDAFTEVTGDTVFNDRHTDGDGHAMVVVGYSDQRNAFKVMNSWGKAWGAGGFGWISYDSFRVRVSEAYVASVPNQPALTPAPSPESPAPPPAPTPHTPVTPAPPSPSPWHFTLLPTAPVVAPTPRPQPAVPTVAPAVAPSVAPAVAPAVEPPPGLSASGRAGFQAFRAAADHKAFALAEDGAWGWRSGRSTALKAAEDAQAACDRHTESTCTVVMIDDRWTGGHGPGDGGGGGDGK